MSKEQGREIQVERAERRIADLEEELDDRNRRLEHAEFLLQEVDHRIKNVLGAVQGIAERTAREAPSLSAFLQAFRPRLAALGKAQHILGSEMSEGASLSHLVRAAVEPYLTEARQLACPDDDVTVPARVAPPLFMALHELASNAAKHGALSVTDGRVEVDTLWNEDTHGVEIRWRESGGPTVQPGARDGFGMTVIRRGVAYELGGRADVRFEPSGIRVTLSFPLPVSRAATHEEGRNVDPAALRANGRS